MCRKGEFIAALQPGMAGRLQACQKIRIKTLKNVRSGPERKKEVGKFSDLKCIIFGEDDQQHFFGPCGTKIISSLIYKTQADKDEKHFWPRKGKHTVTTCIPTYYTSKTTRIPIPGSPLFCDRTEFPGRSVDFVNLEKI